MRSFLESAKMIFDVTVAFSPSNFTPGIQPEHTPLATKNVSLEVHNSSAVQTLSILLPSIFNALILKFSSLKKSFPSKKPPKDLTAAAVITPSGAAPIPYNKSTLPSAAFKPADTSPSPINNNTSSAQSALANALQNESLVI